MIYPATNIRPAGVEGIFYPADKFRLSAKITTLLNEEKPLVNYKLCHHDIIGGIIPHAGIKYCGRQQINFFEIVSHSATKPDTVVILHPNHFGYGPSVSVDDHEFWAVPTGMIRTDMDLAEKLEVPFSAIAQKNEHSAEVIVPFLIHFLGPGIMLVSINMLDQQYQSALLTAHRLFNAIKLLKRKVLVIASSDFSHFVKPEEAIHQDDMVLKDILSGDTEGVHSRIIRDDLSVCGYGPIMTLMEYSRMAFPEYKTEIISRGDSGNKVFSRNVVSYVSVLFYI